MINGIIVINKPKGMTSADVVYKLRKSLHIKKIGHAGTLDPDVTGVLPIAIGQATKLIDLMHTKAKTYQGSGILGYSTDSYDISGKVLQKKAILNEITSIEIQNTMNTFLGRIEQVPPIYSAVKVNGKRLYEYARAGIEVERPVRKVNIYEYKLLDEPKFDETNRQETFDFEIESSKGTYVRSLVNDLGEKIGVPAVMSNLIRTSSAGFNLNQSVTLEQLEKNPNQVDNWLISLEKFFATYPTFNLTEDQWKKVKNGNQIMLDTNEKLVALRYNNKVKAIYKLSGSIYTPKMMLLQNS